LCIDFYGLLILEHLAFLIFLLLYHKDVCFCHDKGKKLNYEITLYIYSATGSQPVEKRKNLMNILTILTIKILWVTIHVKGVHKMQSYHNRDLSMLEKHQSESRENNFLPVAFGTLSVRHHEWH
jgi:hypothetical protein